MTLTKIATQHAWQAGSNLCQPPPPKKNCPVVPKDKYLCVKMFFSAYVKNFVLLRLKSNFCKIEEEVFRTKLSMNPPPPQFYQFSLFLLHG